MRRPLPLMLSPSFLLRRKCTEMGGSACSKARYLRLPSLPNHWSSLLFSSWTTNRKNPVRNKPAQNPTSEFTSAKEPREIIRLVNNNERDLEIKLNRMNVKLSPALVSDVLRSSNKNASSAVRFFHWAKGRPGFCPNQLAYNQVIDLVGMIGDFDSMRIMVEELGSLGYCLDDRAFGFLVHSSSARDSVVRVVEILNSIGGRCRKSGVHSLISKLSQANMFDLAALVMKETVKKTSYFNILIGAKCRNENFEDARRILEEMRMVGCDPNVSSYNFLLSGLCKKGKMAEACELIELMEASGYLPNEITYEAVAFHACRIGRMDFAIEFLDKMLAEGLKPRFTTHAAFIKGYFFSGQVHGAHRYVVEMCSKDKSSATMNYSLLVSLFRKLGRLVDGFTILLEMMDKGFKPNFSVYIKLVKDLHCCGREEMSEDLKARYSRFVGNYGEGTGG